MQYLREHPDEGRALMRQNLSWVFFREITGDGPLGALEVPVRRESSVAADPAYTPLGAPVFLTTDRREVNGLWIAQVLHDSLHRRRVLPWPAAEQPALAHDRADRDVIAPVLPGIADPDHLALRADQPAGPDRVLLPADPGLRPAGQPRG